MCVCVCPPRTHGAVGKAFSWKEHLSEIIRK